MEAVVKPELVWLLEDQSVLDGLKREEDLIRFPDIKDEFLKTDVQGFRHNIFQIDAGIKEEAPISDDRNEDMKTEMDFEEHGILEESTKYFPSHKRSDNTGAQQCGDINIYTNKSDRTVTKRMKSHTGGSMEIGVVDSVASSSESVVFAQTSVLGTDYASTSADCARSLPNMFPETPSRPVGKRKLEHFETEDTGGMTHKEIQRYFLLKQVAMLKVQEEGTKLRREVLLLKKEKLLWDKEKREQENELPSYTNL